jgi:hypothetical protein
VKVFLVHTTGQVKRGLDLPDRQALTEQGFELVSPNRDPLWSNLAFAQDPQDRDAILADAIAGCQLFVFRTYLDGRIPRTLNHKVQIATKLGVLVLELPNIPLAGDRFIAQHESKVRDERNTP